MPPGARQVHGLNVKLPQFRQTFRTHARKFLQQLAQRFALAFAQVPQPIERGKGLGIAESQDGLGARYPVGALGVNQMSHHVEGGPSFLAFIA